MCRRRTPICDVIFSLAVYIMTVLYSSNCISQRKVYEWVELFKVGQTSVVDDAIC
jgi:hypothetical protein